MTVQTVADIIEEWAPKPIAWDRDNVGLQIGDLSAPLRGVLVSLDITPPVIREAARRRANLVLSHHPLLFRPLHRVTDGSRVGDSVRMALGGRINIFSAHTNLDFTSGGTSAALAGALGLVQTDFLSKPYKTLRKIVTYVPASHSDRVASAMADAGAGRIGNYDHCSFRISGTGTFRGNEASNPATGRKGRIVQTSEVRLEMIAHEWETEKVLRAMRLSHPYEEVAYDVYPMENRSAGYGLGIIGRLPKPVGLRGFLALVQKRLGTGHLRYTGNTRTSVRTVAVCGGSGSELLEEAIGQKADVFLTADIKYHAFQDAENRITLVDAGHFETEFPVVYAAAARLRRELRKRRSRTPVFVSRVSTNPVMYF